MAEARPKSDQPPGVRRRNNGALLWATIVVSWALAALNFEIAPLPGLRAPRLPVLAAIMDGPTSKPIFALAALAWCGLAGFAFWRWRWRAWPVLLSAPFALSIVITTAFAAALLIALCFDGGVCAD